jgi:hypothetical protein
MPTLSIVKLFEPFQLSASVATIYTVPGPAGTILKDAVVRFTNTDSSPHTITVHAVVSGGVVANGNKIISDGAVAVSEYLDLDIGTLKEGDTIRAAADVTMTITVHAQGGVLYVP